MFNKLSAAFVAILALSVAAAPSSDPSNQCNPDAVQCCDSVQNAGSGLVPTLLGLLGVSDIGANVPIGVTCSPITGIGAGGGSSCTAQPVCCTNNSFNGIIAIGCMPININL